MDLGSALVEWLDGKEEPVPVTDQDQFVHQMVQLSQEGDLVAQFRLGCICCTHGKVHSLMCVSVDRNMQYVLAEQQFGLVLVGATKPQDSLVRANALFQLGVLLYDGLSGETDLV